MSLNPIGQHIRLDGTMTSAGNPRNHDGLGSEGDDIPADLRGAVATGANHRIGQGDSGERFERIRESWNRFNRMREQVVRPANPAAARLEQIHRAQVGDGIDPVDSRGLGG